MSGAGPEPSPMLEGWDFPRAKGGPQNSSSRGVSPHERSCHILLFRTFLRNLDFPPEPAKAARNSPSGPGGRGGGDRHLASIAGCLPRASGGAPPEAPLASEAPQEAPWRKKRRGLPPPPLAGLPQSRSWWTAKTKLTINKRNNHIHNE